MSKQLTIREKVLNIVSEKLILDEEGVLAITDNTTLEFLGADDDDLVEIIMECEEVFNTTFSVEEERKIAWEDNATVKDLIDIVESRIK